MTSEGSNSTGGKPKGGINKLTIYKIKHLSADYDIQDLQLLIIKDMLKDLISSIESDQDEVINIDNESPTTVDLSKKVRQIKYDIGGSDVNIRWRREAVDRLISKAGSDYTID